MGAEPDRWTCVTAFKEPMRELKSFEETVRQTWQNNGMHAGVVIVRCVRHHAWVHTD